MKINITKKQYQQLIKGLGISNGLLGLMGDALPDSDYKKQSNELQDLQDYVEGFAKEFDYETATEEEFYPSVIMPILEDYDDYATHSKLSNDLAWRDFRQDHTEEEISAMSEKNNGYFGVVLHPYEKKYWDEFNQYNYDRLIISAISSKNKKGS